VPYLTDHFPQKSPIISGSYAKIDLQLQASYKFSPPCRLHLMYYIGGNFVLAMRDQVVLKCGCCFESFYLSDSQ